MRPRLINNPEEVKLDSSALTIVLNREIAIPNINIPYDSNLEVTLEELYQAVKGIADNKKIKVRTILVLFELGLSGYIYRYGNHGEYWELVGYTCGYA